MFCRTTIICVVYRDLKKLIEQKLVFGENRWLRNIFFMAYFWRCQLQLDILIEKFDIFKHNYTQKVLTHDHHLCCLQWLEKINLTKIGVWQKSWSRNTFLMAYFWCCQLQFDIIIVKFDIFKHNCTQNVLTCDHHYIQWLEKINLTKN